MSRYWIGVASRNHVRTGEAGGFCQLGHGKAAPVRRLSPGDGLVYYSPREGMKEGARLQAFTAIGRVRPGEVYPAQQTACFCPFRRDVDYLSSQDAPIAPLLDRLSFSSWGGNWGILMRRGLFEIPEPDFDLIAEAMGVSFAQTASSLAPLAAPLSSSRSASAACASG